jgi:drug/metabolite transporter (DMT)-like permease
MSFGLISLILVAAFVHAGWNFFAKRAGGGLVVLWLGAVLSSLVVAPTAIVLQNGQPLTRIGLTLVLISGVVHCAYWWALAGMYRYGDISLAYPIARGSGVMGTALGSVVLLHDHLTPTGLAGIAAVCAGVFAIGYQRRLEPVRARAVLMALITGATITAYSLIDDRGVESMHPPTYLAIETAVGAALLGIVSWRRLRASIVPTYRAHRSTIWIIAIGSPLAYLIILFAYSLGPVGYVVAVREFSVAIAAILGGWILKERIGGARRIGIALVVLGMVLIKLA